MKTTVMTEKVDWGQLKRLGIFLATVIVLFGIAIRVYAAMLVPISVSIFLSFLLAPVVERLDQRSVHRTVVVALILFVAVSLFSFAVFKVIPGLYREILALVELGPQAYETISREWLPSIRDVFLRSGLISEKEFNQLIQESRNLIQISEQVHQALHTIWTTAPRLLGTIINIVMVPLLTFFLLRDYRQLKMGLCSLVPRDLQSVIIVYSEKVSATLRSVLKGQAIIASILGVLYVCGLSLIGLKSAVAIGLVSGLCRFIPYLDVVVGVTLSMMVVFSHFQGFGQLIAVGLVFLIVQSIDGMIITPRVIGDRVGIHPVIVIVSIIAFADLFGFKGVLLAIPIIAVVKVTWNLIKPFYFSSRAYDISYKPLPK